MIFDSISNKENYKEEKEIYQTLNFFEKLKKWDDVESNAIIQKDWISANPVSFLSKDESECMYEAHRKHIDVHYIMEGIEKIATADVKNLQEKVPFMALEKDSQCEPEFKKKLEDYQELKKQYHQQKQALSNEGLVAVANIKINVPHPKAEERFKDGSMKLY